MEVYLGIDVGGTNLKFGIVTKKGKLLKKEKYPTKDLRKTGDFINGFVTLIGEELKNHPEIKKVGIAVPGMISKNRQTTVFMANVPEFNDVALIPILQKKYPEISFFLENDANAAALGELHFAKNKVPKNFLFMTLGTGLGSAAILKGKIFKGGDGNAMEAGHIITSNGKTAEDNMGKHALIEMVKEKIKNGKKTRLTAKNLEAKDIIIAAMNNDPVAVNVFEYVGTVLGEALVSTIRILDIKTVFIGGGVSKAFYIVEKNMMKILHERLPNYYTDNLDIRLATLGNDAGIIGAAALCFKK
ncbi:ROK family protein [Wenyingzhuangia sp. 2_MG-2023]|uniref:ROK family protein n=1 Tax=Wenyingzhuangia sp. 2_MG-2023 TaxID=3062639 RepID=UPI0026E1382C|nr:ROK family protein [Wenyingzhuangia sp. 2_MG-2023]MDO6738688.1 ROK family protein [Wenyingzhuangia sp. 2_MG-2023]MDO6802355.1 ROK family protein [Wenyingzhuangia sp. 1_MG-2023]